MKTKHRPGPWVVGWDDGSGRFKDDAGAWILDANEDEVVRGGKDDWSMPIGVLRPDDARLIAAAPDLLNALTVLADAAESRGIPADAARAAIAKAIGNEV